MITISDFREWLRTKVVAPNWSSGALRSTEGKAIVIYNGRAFVNPTAIGGLQNSSYKGKGIRILVIWNKNIVESETKALEVFSALFGQTGVIKGKRIIKFNMRDAEPIFLGVDGSGNYEYVIDLEIITER